MQIRPWMTKEEYNVEARQALDTVRKTVAAVRKAGGSFGEAALILTDQGTPTIKGASNWNAGRVRHTLLWAYERDLIDVRRRNDGRK